MDIGDGFAFYLNLASFFVGLAKAGLSSFGGMITPLLLVPLSEPRLAVGLGALLFVIGDTGAALYYIRSACLKVLLRLLPIAGLGMLAAFLLGKHIPTGLYLIIITVLSGMALLLLVWTKCKPSSGNAPQVLLLFSGAVAGLTTVLGNVSGIFMNLYLSTLKLPKQQFVATMALFYLVVNTTKMLVYYFYWHSLDMSVLSEAARHSLWVLASLLGGLVLGIFAIKKMNEWAFSFCVVLASVVSFVLLLWRTLQHFQVL